MKIKDGYILRKIGTKNIVIYTGNEEKSLHGMMSLNDMSAFLWNRLIDNCSFEDLVDYVLSEYEADRTVVLKDVQDFIDVLNSENILEN